MPDNLPTNSDAAKRKFLPEATSNFPIAKVVKTVVSDPSPSDVEKLATSPAIKEEDIAMDDELTPTTSGSMMFGCTTMRATWVTW
jgi:hypothetical protein